jgi:NDP-sugar pyrophosphorylase family protein
MQCVILAGGLGTRMRPVTQELPKALVPVDARPFADLQLAWLARQSIREVVYCVGYRGRQIIDHVGDGSPWGVNVTYADEGTTLRGTAGALRLALDAGLLAENFFILYGDSFLPIDFRPVWSHFHVAGRPALMTVMRNENRWDRSNVVFTPPLVTLYDKRPSAAQAALMRHIDYGLSILSRELIAGEVPAEAVVDLADVLRRVSLAGDLAGYEVTERFYEVGSPEGLDEFRDYVARSGL